MLMLWKNLIKDHAPAPLECTYLFCMQSELMQEIGRVAILPMDRCGYTPILYESCGPCGHGNLQTCTSTACGSYSEQCCGLRRFAPNLKTAQDSKTLALKIISQYQHGPQSPSRRYVLPTCLRRQCRLGAQDEPQKCARGTAGRVRGVGDQYSRN